jgi:hypothetical protein
VGEIIFPACCHAKRYWWWEAFLRVSRVSKQKKFSSIENIFVVRQLNKCLENFSVLLAEAEAGGNPGWVNRQNSLDFAQRKI